MLWTMLLLGCGTPHYAGEWRGACAANGVELGFRWFDIDLDRPGALDSPDADGEIEVFGGRGEIGDAWAPAAVDILHCADPDGCDLGAADDLVDKPEGYTRISFTNIDGMVLMLEPDAIDKKALEGVCWIWEGWGTFEADRERSALIDGYYDQNYDEL